MIKVQQQEGSIDCGLFALAFCQYILCVGENPTDVYFKQDKMREHLMTCIKTNSLSRFPTDLNKIPHQCNPSSTKLTLYCTCRMHWVPNDEKIMSRYVFLNINYSYLWLGKESFLPWKM